MVVKEMKCEMCGHRFNAELLDRDDPREQYVPGAPLRCPKCNSTMLEPVRVVRRVTRRVS
jgi:predicted Zn-ribbon and HTH transcriptional regulator